MTYQSDNKHINKIHHLISTFISYSLPLSKTQAEGIFFIVPFDEWPLQQPEGWSHAYIPLVFVHWTPFFARGFSHLPYYGKCSKWCFAVLRVVCVMELKRGHFWLNWNNLHSLHYHVHCLHPYASKCLLLCAGIQRSCCFFCLVAAVALSICIRCVYPW